MSKKTFYYLAAFLGSVIGSLIPAIWGADILSFWSLILSAVFAVLGIYFVYKFL